MNIEQRLAARSHAWKKIIMHESFEFFLHFVFLAVFLVAFTWYRRLILANYHIQYHNYWMPLIEAAILAKVIMLGDSLHLGERLQNKPLAVVTLYQTMAFSLLVALSSLAEHTVEAMIHGKTPQEGIAEIAEQGLDNILAWCVVILAAFIPFFSMKQIEKVFGAERIRRLFFLSGAAATEDPSHSPAKMRQPASSEQAESS